MEAAGDHEEGRATTFAVALSTGLVLAANALVVFRRAVGLVFATFHARPPEREGDPHTCRHCGAPLARAAESPLATCVYCRSDNVIGIDLPSYAEPEERQAAKLDELLAARRKERRLWARLAALALVSLVGSGVLLKSTIDYVRAHPAERHAPRPPKGS
jgi:hypothetical protein